MDLANHNRSTALVLGEEVGSRSGRDMGLNRFNMRTFIHKPPLQQEWPSKSRESFIFGHMAGCERLTDTDTTLNVRLSVINALNQRILLGQNGMKCFCMTWIGFFFCFDFL